MGFSVVAESNRVVVHAIVDLRQDPKKIRERFAELGLLEAKVIPHKSELSTQRVALSFCPKFLCTYKKERRLRPHNFFFVYLFLSFSFVVLGRIRTTVDFRASGSLWQTLEPIHGKTLMSVSRLVFRDLAAKQLGAFKVEKSEVVAGKGGVFTQDVTQR